MSRYQMSRDGAPDCQFQTLSFLGMGSDKPKVGSSREVMPSQCFPSAESPKESDLSLQEK